MSYRLISKNSPFAAQEFGLALQSLLTVELVTPGEEFWLLSPWLSNIPVIDNSTERFSAIVAHPPNRHILLAEYFSYWLKRGQGRLFVVTRFIDATITMRRHLEGLREHFPDRVKVYSNDELHEKICLTSHWMLSGSMNWTKNGLRKWDEFQRLDASQETLALKRLELYHQYGDNS